MNSAGQFDEAIQTLQQLKAIVPNDLDIAELGLEIRLNELKQNID